MTHANAILTALSNAFPAVRFEGVVASHDCDECSMLRSELSNKSWTEVAEAFVVENDSILPLLTPEAYRAFLPAWLRLCVANPDCTVTGILLVNLCDEPPVSLFSAAQVQVIIDAVNYICTDDFWGVDDEVNIEYRQRVDSIWGAAA